MADDTARKDFGPRKRLNKGQAIGVMITGGILLVFPWFIPSEQGSTLHLVRMAIGMAGFTILCLGSYFRP